MVSSYTSCCPRNLLLLDCAFEKETYYYFQSIKVLPYLSSDHSMGLGLYVTVTLWSSLDFVWPPHNVLDVQAVTSPELALVPKTSYNL